MSTENIIQEILSDNLSSARKHTEELLYSKLSDSISGMKNDVTSSVYEDAIGAATLAEKRKAKKNGDDEDYAKKTDKEDDGEGLDPVDSEDGDVDNDGDSDESDDYLKNRRKTVKKAVKKGDDEEEEEEEEEVEEGAGDGRLSHIYGMLKDKYMKLTDSQKDKIKTKYHKDQEQAEKEKGHA